jgi:hypothetical protein
MTFHRPPRARPIAWQRDARIVDQDVEPVGQAFDGPDRLRDGGAIRHIACTKSRLSAGEPWVEAPLETSIDGDDDR